MSYSMLNLLYISIVVLCGILAVAVFLHALGRNPDKGKIDERNRLKNTYVYRQGGPINGLGQPMHRPTRGDSRQE